MKYRSIYLLLPLACLFVWHAVSGGVPRFQEEVITLNSESYPDCRQQFVYTCRCENEGGEDYLGTLTWRAWNFPVDTNDNGTVEDPEDRLNDGVRYSTFRTHRGHFIEVKTGIEMKTQVNLNLTMTTHVCQKYGYAGFTRRFGPWCKED